MNFNDTQKISYVSVIRDKLSQFSEIDRVVLFGSFVNSNDFNDIDIAIIQNSDENFLTLSLKYRKVLRELSKTIPLDIIPINSNANGVFLEEINKGEVVYER